MKQFFSEQFQNVLPDGSLDQLCNRRKFLFCRSPLLFLPTDTFCVRADAGRCCSDGENGNCVKMRHYKKVNGRNAGKLG